MTPAGFSGGGRVGRIPWRRLRPPGVRSADGLTWATRAGVALTTIAAVWLVMVLVRPLPAGEAAQPDSPPSLPSVEARSASLDQRRALLAVLTSENLFDDERTHWAAAAPAAAASESAPSPSSVKAHGATAPTARASVPEEVKLALTGLALRGVYRPPDGSEAVALISRVHAGPNPLVSDPFREGDEFEDKQHPQSKWVVRSIDASAGVVLLERGGAVVALEMFPSGGVGRESAGASAAVAEPPTGTRPVIVESSREEVAAELKAAGLGEDEVARLLDLAGMSAAEAAAASAMDAMARDMEANERASRRAPPAGLDAIIKLLRTPPGVNAEPEPSPPPGP